MVSDDDLIERLGSLQQSINNVRADMAEEGRKRDIRIRTNRILNAVSIIGVLVAIAVGGIGIKQIHDADASRKQRTVAACEQANITAQNIADAAKANFDAFIDLIVDSSEQPPPMAVVDAAKKRQHEAIQAQADKPTEDGGLHRDCSPEGLARYYAPK